MSVYKERVSVTLGKHYLDFLARLVEEGIYMDRGSAIRAALRLLFRFHGIPPFARAFPVRSGKVLERKERKKEDDREAPTSGKEGPICGG